MEIKIERLTLIREFIVTQMNHWTLFSVYMMLMIFLKDILHTGSPSIPVWAIMGIFPFLLYVARRFLRQLWSLCLSHAAILFVIFLLPAEHSVIRIFQVLFGVVYVFYSIGIWVKTDHKRDGVFPPLAIVGIYLFTYFLQHMQGHILWDRHYFFSLIAVMWLYMIVYYLEQYQQFLSANSISAGHLPAGDIFKSGLRLVLAYTGIGILALYLFTYSGGLLHISVPPMPSEQPFEPLVPTDWKGEEGGFSEPGNSFWLWDFLVPLLKLIATAVILFLLIKILISLARFISHKLKQRPILKVYGKSEITDLHENCEIVSRKDRKSWLPFLPKSPQEHIRHLYKKRILSSRRSFPKAENLREYLNRYTARESGEILERENLARLYEKARYSGKPCDSKDVKQMRESCK